jgi:coproporphyrinogen III oxidase-like Fe-S oxidoreductase
VRSGINLSQFKERLQIDLLTQAASEVERLINQGLLVMKDERLALTDQGVLVSNYVIASILADL